MKSEDVSADIRVFIKSKGTGHHSSGLGLGVVELCERVDRLGSLNRAAADMGMAYSKAWRIVKNTEEGLGLTLFVRQGARGSHLTEEAKALISLYRRVQRETVERANAVLKESLDELVENGVLSRSAVPNLEKKASPELIAQVRALGL